MFGLKKRKPEVSAEQEEERSQPPQHRVRLLTGGHEGHRAFTSLFDNLAPLVGYMELEHERLPVGTRAWSDAVDSARDDFDGYEVAALSPFVQKISGSLLATHQDPVPKKYLQRLMTMDRVIVIALDLNPTASPWTKASHFNEDKRTSWDPKKIKAPGHSYTYRRIDPENWSDFGAHVIWVLFPSRPCEAHDIGEHYASALSALNGKEAVKDVFDGFRDEELQQKQYQRGFGDS